MLTPRQEKYLLTIPEDKVAAIKPFDPKSVDVANEIIRSIKEIDSSLDVLLIGSSALRIAGQGDVDIYICSRPQDFPKILPELKSQFGEPTSEGRFKHTRHTLRV
ncbi:hypothetical protein HY388_00215 [Candidatus Daviesbacteria bacterium]|nr:hypothetical protein [Candidatus Daviesbacteria bacterium]